MYWFYFALLAAICESLKDLFSKHGLHSVSPQLAALAASAIPIPLLLCFVLIDDRLPTLGPSYLPALAFGGTLNILALWQFMRALQASDLSLAIPFVSFTPIFLLFTSPLLVGEVPNSQDITGILCIVGGAYMIQIPAMGQGWLAPIISIAHQPGPRRMLAVLYSLTSNFDKIGIQNSSPIFWSLSLTSVMTIGFAAFVFLRPQQQMSVKNHRTLLFLGLIGFFQGIGLIFHANALSLGPVPSVIAIKRTSILFATLWGFLLLREHHIRERLSGTILMIIGMGLVGWN